LHEIILPFLTGIDKQEKVIYDGINVFSE